MPVPDVSVVIPLHDGARFLGATLESLFAQTFRAFEALVVDDGSTDAWEEAAAPWRSRLEVLRLPHGGIAEALNAGIARSRAPLVAILEQDDLWHPERLAEVVRAFDGSPASDLVHTGIGVFRDGADLRRIWKPGGLAPGNLLPSGPLGIERIVSFSPSLSNLAIRREALEQVGPFNGRYRLNSDFDLYLRMAERGLWNLSVERVLCAYRFHPGSSSRRRPERRIWHLESAWRRGLRHPAVRRGLATCRRHLGQHLIETGRLQAARTAHRGALALDAGAWRSWIALGLARPGLLPLYRALQRLGRALRRRRLRRTKP